MRSGARGRTSLIMLVVWVVRNRWYLEVAMVTGAALVAAGAVS